VWREGEELRTVVAPLSVVVSAFAPVGDVRRTLTPQLRLDGGPTTLPSSIWGGGATIWVPRRWAQVYSAQGGAPADMKNAALLRRFAAALTALRARSLVLAYHDRADGGLAVDAG